MSDERDFVDLDKVVKEKQMKRPTSKAATTVRPVARGRFMDMVKPGARVRPVSRNNTAATAKPVQSSPTPRADVKNRSAMDRRRVDMVKPVAAPAKVPSVRPAPAAIPEPKPRQLPKEKPEMARPNLFSDDDFAKDEKAPDANNYSLGGRSPFIPDAKVDKRPLGPNVPESNARAIRSTKNVYSQKTPLRSGIDDVPSRGVITVAPPKRKSGWLWAVVTLGVIAAGGGIGLLAFMIFAQN